MKNILRLSLVAGLAAIAAPLASAKVERNVVKSFTVTPGGMIDLSTQGGNLTVETGSDGNVKVTAVEKIRADSESEADDLLKALTLTIEQSGNDVRASAKYDSMNPTSWHWGSWPPVQVDFIVTVPASFAAQLKTSGGNIKVADLHGAVTAHTSGGSLILGKIGGVVEGSTSGGNISLAEGGGKISLHTSGGNILAGKLGGEADLETSGGNIAVESAGSALRARTSGGSVRVTFPGPIAGDSELRSSGGSIHATVLKTAGFSLDASTSGGSVRADGISITLASGGQGKNHLSGDVNGGGPKLRLRTSGGNVELATS